MLSTLTVYIDLNDQEVRKVVNLGTALIILIGICQILGCGMVRHSTDAEFARGRELWLESKIVNYNFVIGRSPGVMYGFVPVLIKVRDGKAISIEPAEEPGQLDKNYDYQDFDTVDKSFLRILRGNEKGEVITVTYNKKHGYPESIHINPKTGSTDSQFLLEISKFEIVGTN